MCDYFPATPPSQRVQFLLGREELEDDEDRQAHDMFCEMEELRAVGEDGEKEWKETARYGSGSNCNLLFLTCLRIEGLAIMGRVSKK